MSCQKTSADRCWQLGTGEVLHSRGVEALQPLALKPKKVANKRRFQKQLLSKTSVKKKGSDFLKTWLSSKVIKSM